MHSLHFKSESFPCSRLFLAVSRVVRSELVYRHLFSNMSRFLIRSAANNLGKLFRRGGSVSLKSEGCLGAACENLMRCTSSMTQPLSRKFSTKVEKDLAKFLDEEMKNEEELVDDVPQKIGEYKVQNLNDANPELTRTFRNEVITVSININGSLVTEGQMEGEQNQEEANEEEQGDLVSKPTFTVEINKGADRNLFIEMTYLGGDDITPEGRTYDIQMFALVKNGERLTANDYLCDVDVMDENLYGYLMEMLEERGIDQKFVEELQEWSTNYEKSKYIQVLKDLRSFVSH
uniref:C1q-binding protein n=1 Tax=Hirudo medicinalis TaxID=6421 RepID=G1FK22_HIRME|nr:C1q-binding protein [Hirudo medicinalis]